MAYLNDLLSKSGRYIIVVTTQSLIEALKKSSQIKTNIMERFDKSFDIIGRHENMLQLFNENLESIGSTADIQLAFISDKHKVEFEKYLKHLEKSVHSMEINNKLTDFSNEGFLFLNQSRVASSIINQYTIKNVSVHRTFTALSIIKKDESSQSNEKEYELMFDKDNTQELLKNEKYASSNNTLYSKFINFASTEIIPPLLLKAQDVDSIKNNDSELIEPPLSYHSNSVPNAVSGELQDCQHFDNDTKSLTSVVAMNNQRKINYFVKNSVTDFCKDLEFNLQGLRYRKVRNLLTNANSKILIKKLMSRMKDGNNICSSLVSRTKEVNKTSCTNDGDTSKEETRNDDRNSSLQVDYENTGKLLHQNMESFRIFERRLHDIRIKRRLDEIRNDRIREIHNIKGSDKFTESNEKRLRENAMQEVIKDLSYNLDITMKKLSQNETRFKTIEKKLKHLEQLSITSSKSNLKDLLSEISDSQDSDKEIELLKDDVEKIELEIISDESRCEPTLRESNSRSISSRLVKRQSMDLHSKKSEIPILKSSKQDIKRILPDKNNIRYGAKEEYIQPKPSRKIVKHTSIPKKTYFHHIKDSQLSAKSKPIDDYKNDILRMPIKEVGKEVVDKIIGTNFRQNSKSSKYKVTSKFNRNNKLQHSTGESKLRQQTPRRSNKSNKGIVKAAVIDNINEEINFDKDYASELKNDPIDLIEQNTEDIKIQELEIDKDFYKNHASVLDNEPINLTKCVELGQKQGELKKEYEVRCDFDVDLIKIKGVTDEIQETTVIKNIVEPDKNKDIQELRPNKVKLEKFLIGSVDELDEEKLQVLSSDELKKFEESPGLQTVIQQLGNKLDNSVNFNAVLNIEDNLTMSTRKNEDTVLESAKNVEPIQTVSPNIEHSSIDYIDAMDEKLMKDHSNLEVKSNVVPVFSTIDLTKYNTVDTDEPFKYKDAIMNNSISIKKPYDGISDKLLINEDGVYEIKKVKEHIKNSEKNKTSKSDTDEDYELKKTREHWINLDGSIKKTQPGYNYELRKVQEHIINVDKNKDCKFVPIDEILKNEMVRCCLGKPEQPRDIFYDIEKAREHLKNKSIICSSKPDKLNNGTDNYEQLEIFDYAVMKAFEHFRTKDILKLKLVRDAADIKKKKSLKIASTLSWDNSTCLKDKVINKEKNEEPVTNNIEVELSKSCPKIGTNDFESENDITKINSKEVGETFSPLNNIKNVKLDSLSITEGNTNTTQGNYNCIARENENVLKAILQNINIIINDNNNVGNQILARANTDILGTNDVFNRTSQMSLANDADSEGPEEKYKKMCNLLKSIKDTIQTHQARVEQTIKNYEDIFQQNTLDVMLQKHSNSHDSSFCHELVDHLNDRRTNFNTSALGLEQLKKEMTEMCDPRSTTFLVNRKNFKTMVSNFMNEQKKNADFFQGFDSTVDNIERKSKPVPHNLSSAQYKTFLNEYSTQFSNLHEEIITIACSNDKSNEVVTKYKNEVECRNSISKPLSEIANKEDMSKLCVTPKNFVNMTETEKGRFEDQITKLSIETEKNQSNANKNISIKSTTISMPMLQKENLEIDKMIEVNKKAFAELESTLKVVKLIGHNSSTNSSLQNIPEEHSLFLKAKCDNIGDNDIHCHDIHESNSLLNLENNNEVNRNRNELYEVITKKDDYIKITRKGSDKEFQREKYIAHSSLKEHEVKKKRYHTRCTSMSKKPKNEDKSDDDLPTALIVTHNTEIPIQMMPMIDGSVFLNNFNIEKSLINFEEPPKELIRVGAEEPSKENYLKESITENVLFKKLISMEEVRKFFGFKQKATSNESTEKDTKKEKAEKELEKTQLKLPFDEPVVESVLINIPIKKHTDFLFRRHNSTDNEINVEEINKIKQQSLRKRHIETKAVDTRTREEIEKSLSIYKQKCLENRRPKSQNYEGLETVRNPQEVVNQLQELISKTDFLTIRSIRKFGSAKSENVSNIDILPASHNTTTSETEISKKTTNENLIPKNHIKTQLESDGPENMFKVNFITSQSNSAEANINKTDLKGTELKQPNDIYNEIKEVVSEMKEMLKRTNNSVQPKNEYKTVSNVETEFNSINKQGNNALEFMENKSKTPLTYIQHVSPNNKNKNRNYYDLEETQNEQSYFQKGSVTEPHRINTLSINKIKDKISEFPEEYIYIEPSKDELNRNSVGTAETTKTRYIQIEDIVERKGKGLEKKGNDKYVLPLLQLESIKPKSGAGNENRENEHIIPKPELEHVNPKLDMEHIKLSSQLEQLNPKLLHNHGNVSEIKGNVNFITTYDQIEMEESVPRLKEEFKIRKSYVPRTNKKRENFFDLNANKSNKFPYFQDKQNISMNKRTIKSANAKHEIVFGADKTTAGAGDLVDIKYENVRRMKNHLKLLAEINMNSAKTKKKFENIYKRIAELNPKQPITVPTNPQLKAWIPKGKFKQLAIREEAEEDSDNSLIGDEYYAGSENVINAYPKNMDLFNQISILPQKTMWNPHYAGGTKMWKRLQHVKKLASEKNSDKLYVLGTKLPTLRMNKPRANLRVAEKLLPVKKPKQYQYQVKKVEVGERIMNITYLVEVKDSKFS